MYKRILLSALTVLIFTACGSQSPSQPTPIELPTPILPEPTPAEPPTEASVPAATATLEPLEANVIPTEIVPVAATDTPEPPAPTTEPAAPTPTLQPLEANSFPQGDTFGDELQFQTIASDPSVGSENGAGIASVRFRIIDLQGTIVHERTEQNPLYCAFGGGDDLQNCNVWRFSEHNNTWPNGAPLQIRETYQLQVLIQSKNGQQQSQTLDFRIELP